MHFYCLIPVTTVDRIAKPRRVNDCKSKLDTSLFYFYGGRFDAYRFFNFIFEQKKRHFTK